MHKCILKVSWRFFMKYILRGESLKSFYWLTEPGSVVLSQNWSNFTDDSPFKSLKKNQFFYYGEQFRMKPKLRLFGKQSLVPFLQWMVLQPKKLSRVSISPIIRWVTARKSRM